MLSKSEVMTARWANPEYKARVTQSLRKACSDITVTSQHTTIMKSRWRDPKQRLIFAVALSLAQTKRSLKNKGLNLRQFNIPHWVPEDLEELYVAIASLKGEEHAATKVRSIKQQRAKL